MQCPPYKRSCPTCWLRLAELYDDDDRRFVDWIFSLLISESSAMDDTVVAVKVFANRTDIATALCAEHGNHVNSSTTMCYLKTNMYLLSDDVRGAMALPYTGRRQGERGEEDIDIDLPWPFTYFTSVELRLSVLKQCIEWCKRSALNGVVSQGGLMSPAGAAIRLARLWTTTELLLLDTVINRLAEPKTTLDEERSVDNITETECFLALLELCVLTEDEGVFLDLIVGDLLCGRGRGVWMAKIEDIITLSRGFANASYHESVRF